MAISRAYLRGSFGGMHILLCMLALAMAMRAMIPAGFMPDMDALRHGKIEMTLCTAGGAFKTATVDFTKHAPDQPHPDHATAACVFSALNQYVLDLPAPTMQAMVAQLFAVLAPAQYGTVPARTPAFGPPLGARAPPVRLG
jgi:hypothetical protein